MDAADPDIAAPTTEPIIAAGPEPAAAIIQRKFIGIDAIEGRGRTGCERLET
jgi:hypothetical protein